MSSARRTNCAGTAALRPGGSVHRRAAIATVTLASLFGATTACGGATPAPHLLVEARAIQTGRQEAEVHQRRQHYTLSAALAVPLERTEPVPVSGTASQLGADELTSPELATVPLDELALAAADADPLPGAAEPRKTAAISVKPQAVDTSPRQRIEPDASEPHEDPPRASQLDLQTLHRLQARYAHEPTAAQVARAAAHAIAGDPQRFASMIRRARWRGIVPDLALGARRGQGVDLRTMLIQDDTARFTSGDDLVLSATLRFELGRLLFAPEEISIAREARVARAAGLELVRDIVQWYTLRRRLMLERDLLGHTSLARESRIAELEALLDIFTNGAFRRMIAGRAAWTTGASTPASRPP